MIPKSDPVTRRPRMVLSRYITMGATNLLAQIFWVLVTDRAEILRHRLEERQDPSF